MYMTQPLKRAAQIKGRENAIIGDNGAVTWAELKERVAKLAGALHGLGVDTGDRVSILALNSSRYLEYYLAAPWAGAVTVPQNIRWSVKEVIYALNDSGSTILFIDEAFKHMVPAFRAEVPLLRHFILLSDKASPDEGLLSYEQILREAKPAKDALRNGSDLFGIFYTGGTTGFPKGVMLSHRNLMTCGLNIVVDSGIDQNSVYLHVPPMFHLGDMVLSLPALMTATTHAFIPGFNAGDVCRAISKWRVTHIFLVPTMLNMLLKDPAIKGADFSSLRQIVYAGSGIPEAVLEEAMRQFPNSEFLQFYGQTELAPLATTLLPIQHRMAFSDEKLRNRLRSGGQPSLCAELEIVDENRVEVPRGTAGQIAVRGSHTMLGYWNKPEETAAALVDGWVLTGDLGYMDEDGFVYIVDRLKDLIISGGENVYSSEVENALASHPSVSVTAVIGVPDKRWGEAVHGIVLLRNGHSATPEELIAHCRKQIAGYKCPRSVEIRTEPFPMTGAGKILKRELRKPYWENQERMVS